MIASFIFLRGEERRESGEKGGERERGRERERERAGEREREAACLHVQHVPDGLVVKGEYPLEDDDVGPVHGDSLGLPAVGDKVVDWHLDLLHLLQPVERFSQQVKVKCIWVIKVVLQRKRRPINEDFLKGCVTCFN